MSAVMKDQELVSGAMYGLPKGHRRFARTAPFTDPAIHALLKSHERNAGSPFTDWRPSKSCRKASLAVPPIHLSIVPFPVIIPP